MAHQSDYSLLNDPEMKEIFDSFLVETREILDQLDFDLVELEKKPEDSDLLNQIFRSFHTVKGTSGFLGLGKLQTLTHRCEDILNILRKGEHKLNDKIMDTILKGFDSIKELVDVIEVNKNEEYPIDNIDALLNETLEEMNNPGESKKTGQKKSGSKSQTNKKTSTKSTAKSSSKSSSSAKSKTSQKKTTKNTKSTPKKQKEETSGKTAKNEKETAPPEPQAQEPEADYSLLNDPEMKDIFDSFLVETREILEQLDLDLVELEQRSEDSDLLNQIFRSFHTIKGTSGFLGLIKLQTLTHRCEDILNILRKGNHKLTDKIMDTILKGYDSIKELVDVIEQKKNESYPIDNITALLNETLSEMNNSEVGEEKNSSEDEANAEKVEDENASGSESNSQEDESKHKDADAAKSEQSGNGTQKTETESSSKKQESQQKQMERKGDNTIRVDVERLDNLLNIVSELVLGRNRLNQISVETSIQYEGTKISRDLGEVSKQIDLMTTELQLSVMKTRMVKIAKVFNKFPRLVRDLSKEAGKDIQLEINGEETELDKTLIEEINDPLVHLVRNSVDHGIESPEDRKKAGKEEKGTITLSAVQEGNNVIITIQDDGKGIDPEKIKQKAVSKGVISEERASELNRTEAMNLIFQPGFSTAEKVTNVSGRGVGMDVVKTNVEKLRGIISIDSEPGEGSTIEIKLPLTLAIIQGLLVEIKGETVALPLSTVIEVVRVAKKDMKTINGREVINLRDNVLPLLDIDNLLYNYTDHYEELDWQYVVVVGLAEKRFGLKVDGLIGQKEIVIKSLGNYLGNIDGVAGSTIMGDGKVVMIADISEIINKLAVTT